jgi:hypothetical protein
MTGDHVAAQQVVMVGHIQHRAGHQGTRWRFGKGLGVLLHKGVAQNLKLQGAVGHGFANHLVQGIACLHLVGACSRCGRQRHRRNGQDEATQQVAQ